MLKKVTYLHYLVSNDKVTIAVPVAAAVGRAGYLDAAIMSYVDVLISEKKSGSLGTAKDEVEYANRVPHSTFTKKEIPKSYLTTQILAPVNDFSGTVAAVYFVIELPCLGTC
jgi:hypothetical protein